MRGRWLGGAAILGYHRVADDRRDPWNLCITPEVFGSQLEILRRDFGPVRLGDVRASRSRPFPVALTFDDGYADFLTEALPLLERFEVPATVFVVAGVGSEGFWWDRVTGALQNASRLPDRMDTEIGTTRIQWTREEGVEALERMVYRTLRAVDEVTRERSVVELGEWAGSEPVSSVPVLDDPQLRELAAHPLVEIGSHTTSHVDLATLTEDRREHEIRGSRDLLEDRLGRTVESFSYPHGGLQPEILAQIRQAGYRRACSSVGGLVQGGSDPFCLPRLWPPDRSGDHFRSWLSGWTGF